MMLMLMLMMMLVTLTMLTTTMMVVMPCFSPLPSPCHLHGPDSPEGSRAVAPPEGVVELPPPEPAAHPGGDDSLDLEGSEQLQ